MIRIAIFAAFVASPAAAQQCGPRADVLAVLADQYGETIRVMGLASNGAAVFEWIASDGGSWTIVATGPDGMTCLIAHGSDFQAVGPAPEPQGDPA